MRVLLMLGVAVAFVAPILAQAEPRESLAAQTRFAVGGTPPCEFRADTVRLLEDGSLEVAGHVVVQCGEFVARTERATIDVPDPPTSSLESSTRFSGGPVRRGRGRITQASDEIWVIENVLLELGKWQVRAERVEWVRPGR